MARHCQRVVIWLVGGWLVGLLKNSFAVTKLNYRVYIFTYLWDDNRVYYNILFTI